MIDGHEVKALQRDLERAPAKVTAEAFTVIADNGEQAQRDAKEFAPVRTGHLRGSITLAVFGLLATVTSEADYGGYVEYGTSDTPAQPYMRPAAELAGPRLEDDLGDVGEGIL